jgi:hypothetical protein
VSTGPRADRFVEVDLADLARRSAPDEVRLADGEMSAEDYASWMAEEDGHFVADRPWERAAIIVDGTFDGTGGRVRAIVGAL